MNMGSSMTAVLNAVGLHQVHLINKYDSSLSAISALRIYHLLTHTAYVLRMLCSAMPPVISFHLLCCSKKEFTHLRGGVKNETSDVG